MTEILLIKNMELQDQVLRFSLTGKAILKKNIIKVKGILFPNILVQVSSKLVEKYGF